MLFSVYYVCDKDRTDAIRTFSINKRFRWTEDGVAMASWEYVKVGDIDKNSVSEVKKMFSELAFGKRKRTFRRTINIGDVIVCEDEALVFTPFCWMRVPDIVWDKARKIG